MMAPLMIASPMGHGDIINEMTHNVMSRELLKSNSPKKLDGNGKKLKSLEKVSQRCWGQKKEKMQRTDEKQMSNKKVFEMYSRSIDWK